MRIFLGFRKIISLQHIPRTAPYFACYFGIHIFYFSKFESKSFQFDDAVVGSVELSLWRLKPIVDAVPCSPDVRACRISRWRCSIIAFHWIALHSVAVSSYCNTLAFLMGRNMALVIRMLFLCKRSFLSLKRPGQSHYLKEQTISFRYFELWDYLYTSW